MKWNPATMRWEVHWKGELIAWTLDTDENRRYWWYRHVVLERLILRGVL